MSTAPRPGWYRDPAGTPNTFRWWDGDTWTELLSASASAPAPTTLNTPADPSSEEAEAVDEFDETRRSRRLLVRRVVAVVVIVALFAGAGLGVGMVLWGESASGLPNETGSGSQPRTGTSPDPGGGQREARTATIQDATLTLPDRPYVVQTDPVALRDVFEDAFTAEAVVHADYEGQQDWNSMVLLASVDDELFSGDDLTAGGAATLTRLSRLLYGKAPTVTDIEMADRSVDNYPGVLVSAKVHYTIDRLPSRYDVVQAWFVRLDDGTVILALTSVPDDASAAVREQAARSLDSLTIR